MRIFLFVFILSFNALVPHRGNAKQYVWANEVSFVSDYYSRGISQTREQPAPQLLSIVFNQTYGLYTGLFVSRVEFNDNDQADQEVDFFAGVQKFLGDWSYRGGIIYYTYPNADKELGYNFIEFDLGVGKKIDPFYVEASIKYSPNYFFKTGKELYSKLEIEAPVSERFTLKGHLAYRAVEHQERFGVPDNYDWSLGSVYAIDPSVDLEAKYVDSSLSEASDCIDICSERVIIGVTYKF